MKMTRTNGWFDAYAAAILESNLDRIAERVASARKAIADRIAQLEAGESAGNREARDLEDALNKLQILVNVSCALNGYQGHDAWSSLVPSNPTRSKRTTLPSSVQRSCANWGRPQSKKGAHRSRFQRVFSGCERDASGTLSLWPKSSPK